MKFSPIFFINQIDDPYQVSNNYTLNKVQLTSIMLSKQGNVNYITIHLFSFGLCYFDYSVALLYSIMTSHIYTRVPISGTHGYLSHAFTYLM